MFTFEDRDGTDPHSTHYSMAAKHGSDIKEGIIMGVDPGTVVMGLSLLRYKGNDISLISMEVLRLSAKKDVYERLRLIHRSIDEMIRTHKPTVFAIEAPFFGKNVQSMLKLGRAQGVAIAVAMTHGLPVTEYSPKEVKRSITGNGNADKEQVWKMLKTILRIEERPQYLDASDALAVAMCHHHQMSSPIPKVLGKKTKGWEAFLQENPHRLKP